MFERLGSRKLLPPVELPKWEGQKRFVLMDEIPQPHKPARPSKPVEVSGPSPADKHVEAVLVRKPKGLTTLVRKPLASRVAKADSKPKKERKTALIPTLTEDYPRQSLSGRQSNVPAAYVEVFNKMTMDGPGIRCPKNHGNVVAARLRQYLVERELLGRAIVQYWDDGDRVFWVAPNF